MTHQYEVVYIFDSALEEAAINEKLERFHAQRKQDRSLESLMELFHASWRRSEGLPHSA